MGKKLTLAVACTATAALVIPATAYANQNSWHKDQFEDTYTFILDEKDKLDDTTNIYGIDITGIAVAPYNGVGDEYHRGINYRYLNVRVGVASRETITNPWSGWSMKLVWEDAKGKAHNLTVTQMPKKQENGEVPRVPVWKRDGKPLNCDVSRGMAGANWGSVSGIEASIPFDCLRTPTTPATGSNKDLVYNLYFQTTLTDPNTGQVTVTDKIWSGKHVATPGAFRKTSQTQTSEGTYTDSETGEENSTKQILATTLAMTKQLIKSS